MKKLLALTAALTLAGGTAFAAPYASKIRVSNTSVNETQTQTISYFLNEDADSVLIEILDSVDAVVASFAGTTDAGANQVVWDLTDDNSGGTTLAIQSDLRVRITADKDNGTEWSEFASNRSEGEFGPPALLQTLFNGFSGADVYIPRDPDSDLFGTVAATSSFTTPAHYALIILNTDLTVAGGDDGLASRALRHPADPEGTNPGVGTSNQATWGVVIDPDDPDAIFVAGQGTPGLTYAANTGGVLSAQLEDADPDAVMSGAFPRGVAIGTVGSTRYAYLAHGTGTLDRVELDGDNNLVTGTRNNMLDFTSSPYSKNAHIDSDGNLYYVIRNGGTSGEADGGFYRWNKATVDAFDPNDTNTALTEANADWVISVDTGIEAVHDIAFKNDGTVYMAARDGGLFEVGNISTATLVTTLTVASDQVLDYADVSTGWTGLSPFGSAIEVDYAGNIYVTDRSTEQIRGFSPPGNTSVAVTAPTSQTFEITDTPTDVRNWHFYN